MYINVDLALMTFDAMNYFIIFKHPSIELFFTSKRKQTSNQSVNKFESLSTTSLHAKEDSVEVDKYYEKNRGQMQKIVSCNVGSSL